MARYLQTLGLLTLLGLTAAVALGLFTISERVRIVVTPDDSGERPDPTSLLRDDVQQLHGDLQALSTAMGDNLQKLATLLQSQIDQHGSQHQQALLQAVTETRAAHDAAVALATHVDALAAAMAEQTAKVTATQVTAPQVTAPVAAAIEPVATPAVTPAAPPAVSPAGPGSEVATPLAAGLAAATPPADPTPAPAAAPPAPAPGFLSFSLPSRQFHFDQEQGYELIPELSRVGFDAKSTLHDFSGVTSTLQGSLRANLADPAGKWTGTVQCDAATLRTGVDGRDDSMRECLDTAHFPQIQFAIQGFVPAADGIDRATQQVRGEVTGSMTIHGVSHDLRMPVELKVDASKRLEISGQLMIKMSDFGVSVPAALGVIKVQDEVKIWLALRARARGGDNHGK